MSNQKRVVEEPMGYSHLSQVGVSLQIDEEESLGFFSSDKLAFYTLMVSNPFPSSKIICSVSVASHYYEDVSGANYKAKKNVSTTTHGNIVIKKGSSTRVKGKIKFADDGIYGGRSWVEVNMFADGQHYRHPGGVRLEGCSFTD